jgi:hypothetical protein
MPQPLFLCFRPARQQQGLYTVDFTGKVRPGGYIVSMEPEGGSKIGSYGGSGNIDAEGRMTFKDVPPGKYTFKADLTETGIDLKALDYMKLFGAGPCDLTVKTVTFTKAGTTQP